jgi:hypothetical protein
MKHINIYILTYYIFFDYFEIQIQYIKYLLIKIAHFIKNKHLYIYLLIHFNEKFQIYFK